MKLSELANKVIDKDLCIGCGMCLAVNVGRKEDLLVMDYSHKHDHMIPIFKERSGHDNLDVICPGGEMNMVELSKAVHGDVPTDDWIGHYLKIRVAHAINPEVRNRSASGGVTTALIDYLFKSKAIDAVYCLLTKGDPTTRTGSILKSASELKSIHGSVYHPALFGDRIRALIEGKEKFAFVGLPCEIASLEKIKKTNNDLASRHILSIGLFCGGLNRLTGVEYYLKKFGLTLKNAKDLDYRYGAWPGRIKLIDARGDNQSVPRIVGNSRWNILRYVVGFQGPWMLPRCRLCPDQVSDFADIAVGDPHLPRFRSKGGLGYSAVVLRSKRGLEFYNKALLEKFIIDDDLTRDELIESQGYTLDNRRHVIAYATLAKILGMGIPSLSVYPSLSKAKFKHYKYALIDLMKIRLREFKFLRPLYIPWQAFEYLFITFAPRVIFNRVLKLFSNK